MTSARSRASIPFILRELWASRDLVAQFVKRDVAIRYTQAVMGFAWALLMPVLIVGAGLIFRVVVSTLSNTPVESDSIASLTVKALPWAFFSGALSLATQSIIAHASLIGKIYFPREALPIASVLAQCIDLLVGFVVFVGLLLVLGIAVRATALLGAVLLVLLVAFTIGAALILSCANLFYRDIKYIVQVILSFGVFATPVFFEPQMLGTKGASIMLALPLSPFIQGIELAIVRHHNLFEPLVLESVKGPVLVWAPWMLLYAAATSTVLVVAGLKIFRSASSRFAEMA